MFNFIAVGAATCDKYMLPVEHANTVYTIVDGGLLQATSSCHEGYQFANGDLIHVNLCAQSRWNDSLPRCVG